MATVEANAMLRYGIIVKLFCLVTLTWHTDG